MSYFKALIRSHFVDLLPWTEFGRKNVGYLFAIAHGAEVIYPREAPESEREQASNSTVSGATKGESQTC